MTFCIK